MERLRKGKTEIPNDFPFSTGHEVISYVWVP